MTLWSFMDKCLSAMGPRMLKKMDQYPLIQRKEIEKRLDAVEYLSSEFLIGMS